MRKTFLHSSVLIAWIVLAGCAADTSGDTRAVNEVRGPTPPPGPALANAANKPDGGKSLRGLAPGMSAPPKGP